MKLGMEDGLATREQSPELPFLLLAEYGTERTHATRSRTRS